jgi:hypothetical protein
MWPLLTVVFFSLFLLPTPGFAQVDGTIQGVVVDESKAALPGVTVTATELATGRQYIATSDERGEYRMVSVAAGNYKVQAELPSFATVVIPQFELLVGQNATIPFTLKLATLQETVTVTGETPIVDTTTARVATNVDRRQLEELPLQGRNWMELALLARGVTANSADNTPGIRDRQFNLNVDGQQVIQSRVSTERGQPRFSREAIAEFQIVTNLFDVTQGRSTGAQVQAISRAGTNNMSGAVYTYFRDDSLNAADPITNTVVPYSNQQVGGALGGPIQRDRLHYFFTYEYEREPQTRILTPPQLPNQTFQFPNNVKHHLAMTRVDQNLSARDHILYRASVWKFDQPFEIGATSHPSQANHQNLTSANAVMSWTRVLSDNKAQELKVGFNGFYLKFDLAFPSLSNTPSYSFPGLTVGGDGTYPQWAPQSDTSVRYDLTWHKSSHDFKIGGEGMLTRGHNGYSYSLRGQYVFSARPPDLERRFPFDAYADPSRWDVSGLDSLVSEFQQNVGSNVIDYDRPIFAAWFGDTWRTTERLTVNYGVRWDDDIGVFDPPFDDPKPFIPFGGPLFKSGIKDHNNIAPRVGFTFDLTGNKDLLLRGGSGMYYNFTTAQANTQSQFFHQLKANTYVSDGRPGFMANPTRNYTAEQIEAGVVPPRPQVIAHDVQTPYAIQTSIGFQKQLGPVTGVDADLTHVKELHQLRGRDINLFYDPVTGYNLDPTRFGRPDPSWDQVTWSETSGTTENLMLSTSISRRLRNNVQGSVSYTYTFRNMDNVATVFGTVSANNQFNINDEWATSGWFQRHTLRANGILNLPYAMNLAGIYSYGSGNYYGTTVAGRPFNKPGTNRLNTGAPIVIPEAVRDRFDGPATIGRNETVPRNALRGMPIHKVDVRLTKIFRLGSGIQISGIAEVFNLLNHKNYGAYVGQVNSTTFGQPAQNPNNTYRSRTGQLAFRVQF